MSTISMIVPVYNAENYIRRCVDSILSQTFQNFELILVDDGSPDNCGAICDEYAAKDSRIRVIHQKNQGQAAARNRAVTEARGEWICFVDSDDKIHPQMLEHLYRAAMEHNAGISMCGAVEAAQEPEDFGQPREWDANPMTMDETGLEDLYHQGEHRYWVIWGKLIRREILLKFPFQPGRIYEDNAVVCRWLHEAGTVANTLQRYYFYQVNPDGTTKKGFSLKQLDFLWALQEQLFAYREWHWPTMYRIVLRVYLSTAVSYYWQCKDLLHSADIANHINAEIKEIYSNCWKNPKLSKEEKLAVYNVAFPEKHHRHEYIIAAKQHIADKGVVHFVCRCIRKILNKVK